MHIPGNFIPKKKRPPHHNGWELTLADMMTLLLCFFVVMLSVAKIDQQQYETVADVMAEAMKGNDAPSKRQDNVRPIEIESKNLFELQLEIAKLIGRESSKAVSLKLRPDAVAIQLTGGVFFKLGSADLIAEALRILEKLAVPLTKAHYKLTVEGHSDNLPIHSPQYPSNWELSSARASSVARFFIAQGFPKNDIQVMGLADTNPLAPNEDDKGNPLPENQAKNRRIVLLVRPAK